MPKYAIAITEKNLALIEFLSPWGRPVVKETNTYFLFTIDSPDTTTDHDIVEEDNLYDYDGRLKESRTILL